VKQSKRESLVEASLNTASGFIVSLFVWQFIAAPLFGYHVTWRDNVLLTALFTAVSILRSYLWRRFFNRGLNRVILRWLRASH
jgi:membrane protein implicated in regulation of membrane protease activity